MKNINNNPCENCFGSLCDKCDFFHQSGVNSPANYSTFETDEDDLPVNEYEDCLLEIEDYDDFEEESRWEEMLSMKNPCEMDNSQDFSLGE